MLALRYAALVALVIWLGGLVTLGGIAAPAVFDVMALRHVPDGRLVAGAVFGEILRRYFLLSYACGGLLLLTLLVRAVLGPRPRRFAWRAAVAVLMLSATAYSGLVIADRIARLQETTNVSPSSLPASDPRRVEFEHLHAMSTTIQLVPLLGGLALIYWELKE